MIAAPAPPPKIVDDDEIWQPFLSAVERQAQSVAATLRTGKLVEIEQDMALIQLPAHADGFVRQWSSNGKKELISRALTELRGRPTGVRFEVDQPTEIPTPKTIAPPIPADNGPIVEFVLKEFGGQVVKVE